MSALQGKIGFISRFLVAGLKEKAFSFNLFP